MSNRFMSDAELYQAATTIARRRAVLLRYAAQGNHPLFTRRYCRRRAQVLDGLIVNLAITAELRCERDAQVQGGPAA